MNTLDHCTRLLTSVLSSSVTLQHSAQVILLKHQTPHPTPHSHPLKAPLTSHLSKIQRTCDLLPVPTSVFPVPSPLIRPRRSPPSSLGSSHCGLYHSSTQSGTVPVRVFALAIPSVWDILPQDLLLGVLFKCHPLGEAFPAHAI